MTEIPLNIQFVIFALVEFQKTQKEPSGLADHLSKLPDSRRETKFFRKVHHILLTDAKQFKHYSSPDFKRDLENRYRQFLQEQEGNNQAQKRTDIQRQEKAKHLEQQNMQAKATNQARQKIEIQRQEKAKHLEQQRMQASATFRSLGNRIARTTRRDELVRLSKERASQVPLMGIKFEYESHCWRCETRISSQIHPKCPECPGYICSSCGNCLCGFLPIYLKKKS